MEVEKMTFSSENFHNDWDNPRDIKMKARIKARGVFGLPKNCI